MHHELSPYVFAQDGNKNLILSTTSPYIVAEIITGVNKYLDEPCAIVPGYAIAIKYYSHLEQMIILSDQLDEVLNAMLLFFIEHKLYKNLKYYERYKSR